MPLRPLDNRVFIRRAERQDTRHGRLILPRVAQDTPTFGVVVAVGPGKLLKSGVRVEPLMKVGQKVHFLPYPGEANEHEVDGKPLILLNQEDVLAVEDA